MNINLRPCSVNENKLCMYDFFFFRRKASSVLNRVLQDTPELNTLSLVTDMFSPPRQIKNVWCLLFSCLVLECCTGLFMSVSSAWTPDASRHKKENESGGDVDCQHSELIHSCSQNQQMASECKRNWGIRFFCKTLEGCRRGKKRKEKSEEARGGWRSRGGNMVNERRTKRALFPAICSRLRLHLF